MAEPPADVASLSTADQAESRIGALEVTDGAPMARTIEALYDHLDADMQPDLDWGPSAGDNSSIPVHVGAAQRRRAGASW